MIIPAALGLNLWATLVLLPALHVGVVQGAPGLFLGGLPLIALAAGVLICLHPRGLGDGVAQKWAQPLLLLAFPASLLALLLSFPDLTGVNVYARGPLLVAALAMLAYGAGVLITLGRLKNQPSAHRTVPIQGFAIDDGARRRALGRVFVVGLAALVPAATFAAAFLRPGAADDLGASYGTAGVAASVGIAVVAMAVPLGVLLVYFGPPMRRPGHEPPLPTPGRRVRSTVLLLLLAAAAALALFVMKLAA